MSQFDIKTRKPVVAKKGSIGVDVEKGKDVYWCTCGLSQNQPFCDGSHQQIEGHPGPMKYTPDESKKMFFCGCKQTGNAPLCDGSHRDERVVEGEPCLLESASLHPGTSVDEKLGALLGNAPMQLGFPLFMLGSASLLGWAALAGDLEGALARRVGGPALTVAGAGLLAVAHGHAMGTQISGRFALGVPHPQVEAAGDNAVPFLNVSRGLGNMVEHAPFALFNVWLCREIGQSPCVAAASLCTFALSRVLYTTAYATGGADARMPGFVLSLSASMLALGVPLVSVIRNLRK